MKRWQLWLGLAVVAGGLSAVGDTNSAPTLNIYPAIELTFLAETNQVYQLQASRDAQTWTNFGPQVPGMGERISKLYSVRTEGRLFHRLKATPVAQAPTNLPPASLTGKIVDFAASDGAAENLTFASDKWVRSSVEGTGTYQFTLNGGIGNLQVTFPSGTVYTVVLTFNADGKSGSWSGNQFYDNSDHPVSPGATFQIEN